MGGGGGGGASITLINLNKALIQAKEVDLRLNIFFGIIQFSACQRTSFPNDLVVHLTK